jgi:hypothetical protein
MVQVNEQLARAAATTGVRRAVETGTYMGDSALILGAIFDRVETVEQSRSLWFRAWLRLFRCRNVRVRLGDSGKWLRPSAEPTLYWLDGHWMGGKTAGANRQCPVLDELRATSPGTHGDWYLIDDARLFTGRLDPGLDPAQWPTLEQIRGIVETARPDYEITVREDLDVIVVRPRRLRTDSKG